MGNYTKDELEKALQIVSSVFRKEYQRNMEPDKFQILKSRGKAFR